MDEILVKTHNEGLVNITQDVQAWLEDKLNSNSNGLLTLFIKHTSAALTINESFDPSAKADIESFLKHLAPRNLAFITHDTEGPDDSPSHMKSVLLNPSLSLIIENGKMVLGTWQGIYLAEFRDGSHSRRIALKYMEG